MKVELIIPIEGLYGKLRNDGYYFRKYRGQSSIPFNRQSIVPRKSVHRQIVNSRKIARLSDFSFNF